MIWRIFWSSHQRFFKELAICSKIPYLADDALKSVEQGCCVIFGLQSTGDAAMQTLLDQVNHYPEMQFASPLSTVAAVMRNFVQNHFPVKQAPPEPPKLPDQPPGASAPLEEVQRYFLLQREAERIKALPAPQPIPELVEIRSGLLNKISTINLPPNPLDDLVRLSLSYMCNCCAPTFKSP